MSIDFSSNLLIVTAASTTTALYGWAIYKFIEQMLSTRARDAVSTMASASIAQVEAASCGPVVQTPVQLEMDEVMARLTAIEQKIDELIARGAL